MSATTAKIAARTKTDNTGITPELATTMYKNLGSTHMAIVELRVAERTEGDDQSHAIKLEVNRVEPAATKDIDEHMRQLERALYFQRNPQQTLTAAARTAVPELIDAVREARDERDEARAVIDRVRELADGLEIGGYATPEDLRDALQPR